MAKRRRIARACDQCRHGKLKCDGRSPRCSKCLETKKACSYGAAAKRRGLKTGYVRALECLWGLVLQKIEGSEAAVGSLLSRASILDFRARDQHGESTSGAESLLDSWKASKIPEKINQLLASTEDSEDETNAVLFDTVPDLEQHHPSISWSSYVQQPKEQAHILPTARNIAETGFTDLSEISRGRDQMPTTTDCGGAGVLVGQRTLPHLLKLPTASPRLLDWYFTYTHSWLPIVDRHVVYRTQFSYPAEGCIMTRQSSDSGEHAVLWAILACASVDEAQTEPTPASLAESTQTSERMYTCARNLIPWENEHEFSLGHVQAMTILALYRWIVHDYKAASSALAHAISIAFSIDLDQINTAWRHQKCPADRVWVGCFVVESLLAMRLGRVPHLQPQQVEPYLPIDETGFEEWEPWRPIRSHPHGAPNLPLRTLSTFNQLARLVCVAHDFLPLAHGHASLQHITDLRAWIEQLPQHCNQPVSPSGQNTRALTLPPNLVNLGLVYLCLELRLCVNLSSYQDERVTLRTDVELINRTCSFTPSEWLPPSWELLANAASGGQDLPSQSRDAALKQLQQDLARMGFRSSGTRSRALTRSAEAIHPCNSSQLPGTMASAMDTILVSPRNPSTERDTISVARERNGQAASSFPQIESNLPSLATARQQESVGRSTNATEQSLLSPLGAPQRMYPATVQQKFAHESIPAEDARDVDPAANQAKDFLNTEILPTMTEEDPFLDYFELFDDSEMFVLLSRQYHHCAGANSCCRQNGSDFMKALGYNI